MRARSWKNHLITSALAPAILLAGGAKPVQAEDAPAPREGIQLEVGAFGGLHLFAKNLELGIADDDSIQNSPKSPSGVFGLRLALNILPWISFEAEGAGYPTPARQNNYKLFVTNWRGHVLAHLATGRVRPFVLVGAGAMNVTYTIGTEYNEIKYDTDAEYHFGAGVKIDLSELVALRFDARGVLLPNVGHNEVSLDWEFLGGLSFMFGGASPPPPPPPPAPIKDSDADGILDNVDKCPNDAEDKDGFEDTDGCPELDNDKDGIPDAADKCPNEAETKNGIDDEDGCPEIDKDGDGILGSKDKCPDEAEDKDGFEDDDGCPDLDNDKDGVPDASDKCPNEPETKNGYQDDDGCPDEVPAQIKKFTGVIKGITFKKNSSDIQKSSFKLLSESVKTLKEYPDLRIEISGHTSSEGKLEKNQQLSQGRADAVKAYLVSAGIAETRIAAIGYGPERPIAENKTNKGREQNRRIEFRLLQKDEVPTPPTGIIAPPPEPPAKVVAPRAEKKSKAKTEAKPTEKAEKKASKKPATEKPATP